MGRKVVDLVGFEAIDKTEKGVVVEEIASHWLIGKLEGLTAAERGLPLDAKDHIAGGGEPFGDVVTELASDASDKDPLGHEARRTRRVS